MSSIDPRKNRGEHRCSQFLSLIRHPQYYSYSHAMLDTPMHKRTQITSNFEIFNICRYRCSLWRDGHYWRGSAWWFNRTMMLGILNLHFVHAQSNTLYVYHENKWKGKWHLPRMHCVEHICWPLFLQRLQQHVDIFHTTMYNIVSISNI